MPVTKNIILTKEKIDATDLSSIGQYLSWNVEYLQYLMQPAGREPYKLLGYISMHVDGAITDIGTQFGSSALALSLNNQVRVDTYDKFKLVPEGESVETIVKKNNISYKVLSAQTIMSKIAESTVVYLDINTDNGLEEIKIINKLQELGFKGILIIDDIRLNAVMENVWNNVPSSLKKIDATMFGHWSGTGIVVYDPLLIDVIIE
jgi:hypothetical protein